MSEIKFACPHCQQHIACDAGYVDMCIVCPSCGKPMVVPVLTASEGTHTGTCIVASIPTPRRKLQSRIPQLDVWTEKEWDEQPALASEQTPVWIISALATTIIAALLKAMGTGHGWIIFTALVGGVVSGIYLFIGAKRRRTSFENSSAGGLIAASLAGVATVAFFMLAIPALALGLLFVGCGACR